ncbi:MAG: hypothetical protein ACTHMI_13560 [Mucilaginibacter sp.]
MEKESRSAELTGREGEIFDFKLAAQWTKNYRDINRGEIISQFFGREILNKLLEQPGCMGIRMYYANDKPVNGWQRIILSISGFLLKVIGNIEGKPHLILVGAAKDGSDILPDADTQLEAPEKLTRADMRAATAAAAPTGLVVQIAMPCPGSANCPKNSLSGK